MTEHGAGRALVGALVALAFPVGAHAAPAVEGYVQSTPQAAGLVRASAPALDVVGIDGVNLVPGAADVTATPPEAAGLVRRAHALGLRTELLVSNYDERIGDFSPGLATALLSSGAKRDAVAATLVERVRDTGFDGVQIDLESLRPGDRPGLVAFADRLRALLPREAEVSMALMASGSAAGYARDGYALPELTRSVGRFVLMAYDQHGPGWSDPGPVGGSSWVRRSLQALLGAGVPAARVDLGVAGYGYRWRQGRQGAGGQVPVARARRLAGDRARWDARRGEWTARLRDGSVLWWSDKRTLAERRRLARAEGLHGLAVWELATSDPIRR